MVKGFHIGLFVDGIVLAISIAFLAELCYSGKVTCFCGNGIAVTLVATAFVVFSIKAFRLYLLLMGHGLQRRRYVLLFCMTSFVSILLPFKAGEIFRLYVFGKALGDYIRGASLIFLDRFVDTLGLLSVILVGKLMFSWTFDIPLLVSLGGVTGGLVALYLFLPGFLRFWRQNLLEGRSSSVRLAALEMIKFIDNAYLDVRQMLQGRFVLLIFMSILSWSVEMGSLIILRTIQYGGIDNLFPRYLDAALMQVRFLPQLNFVVISSVLLLLASVIALFVGTHKSTNQ